MNNMKGMFINCPARNCKKMLFKNAYFRPGTFFTTRCYHCGSIVTIQSENLNIKLILERVKEEFDEEDEDIVNLSI
jgi:hypothetical protein